MFNRHKFKCDPSTWSYQLGKSCLEVSKAWKKLLTLPKVLVVDRRCQKPLKAAKAIKSLEN